MLIYAKQFYRCCYIILLSDDIGEVLLLPMLTARQCWCENSKGATHLHSLHGLLDTAGSWGLLQLFLLLCLYWHNLLHKGYEGVKNENCLKSFQFVTVWLQQGPLQWTWDLPWPPTLTQELQMSIRAPRGGVRNLRVSQQSLCLLSKSLPMPVSKVI